MSVTAISDRFDSVIPERWNPESYPVTISVENKENLSLEEMEKLVNAPLEERIQWIRDEEGGLRSEWVIDTVVRFKGPSQPVVKRQFTYWNGEAQRNFTLAGSYAAISLISSIIGIIATRTGQGSLQIAAVVGVIASGIFAAYHWIESGRAEEAATGWAVGTNPALIACLRNEVYEGKNETAKDLLHPLEQEALKAKKLLAEKQPA